MKLITGGTGTVGQALAEALKDVRIMSRNEDAQIKMSKRLLELDYYTGDIRDLNDCYRAVQGCNAVYHLAAMKHVGRCEEQPEQAIKTNVIGTMNILNASIASKVNKFVYFSTDKCVNPVSTYGRQSS